MPPTSTRQVSAPATSAEYFLLPRPRVWPWVLVLGVAATIVLIGWALLGDRIDFSTACLVGGIATVVCLLPSIRFDLRRTRLDQAVEHLAPLLGFTRPTRSKVRVHRWSGLIRGAPRTVVLHYARPLGDSDPSWKQEVTSAVAYVFGAEYVVHRHHDLKCRLVLRRMDTVSAESAGDPHGEAPRRIRTLVAELLGESAIITHTEYDADGELRVLEVHEPAHPRLASASYQQRIARLWSTMMPGRWRADFDLVADRVRFDRRPMFDSTIWLPENLAVTHGDVRAEYPYAAARYAVDEDGYEVAWLPAQRPNLHLVGAPGTGRTSTTRAIIMQFTRLGWPVWILDAEEHEFSELRGWPNIAMLADTAEEQVAALHHTYRVLSVRDELISEGIAGPEDFEPILVVLGPWQTLCDRVFGWYAWIDEAEDPYPPALGLVSAMVRKAARCRVHFVITGTVPEAEFATGVTGEQVTERVSLGRLSSEAAAALWGSGTAGVSIPRNCPGRGMSRRADGIVVEVQTYLSPDPAGAHSPEEVRLLGQLRPPRSRNERLLMVPPEHTPDTRVSYWQVAEADWEYAADRPDLDPLRVPPVRQPAPPPPRPAPTPAPDFADDAVPAGPIEPARLDYFAGYGEMDDIAITEIRPGDLVLVDESNDLWATATADPEPDVIDTQLWCLEWRSDDDDDGTIQAGEDELLVVRKPLTGNVEEVMVHADEVRR